MGIPLHPRYSIVRQAGTELGDAVLNVLKKHKLTYLEIVQILTDQIQTWVKYGIRAERHPNDPSKKGDEA